MAEISLDQAIAIQRRGDLAEAERQFVQILKSEPNNALALFHLGTIFCQNGRFGEGIELFRKSIALNSRSARAFSFLGLALARVGQTAEAIDSFDRAIACEPAFAEAHGNRADLLAQLGRHAEAIEGYQRALAISPGSAEDHCNLGVLLQDVHRHEDAVGYFDQAIRLRPDFAEAHLNRANALARLDRYDEAVKGYDKALALRSGWPEASFYRGNTLRKLGRADEALLAVDTALARMPQFLPGLKARALILIDLGRENDALATLDQALSLKADDVDALVNRGAVLSGLSRHHEALKSFAIALRINPNSVAALNNQAIALVAIGCASEALDSSARAMSIDPSNADAKINQANALSQLFRRKEALALYDEVLGAQPGNIVALANRAAAFERDGQFERAIQDLEGVLKVEPDHAFAFGLLCQCRLAICRWDGFDDLRREMMRHVREDISQINPMVLLGYGVPLQEQLDGTKRYVRDRVPRNQVSGERNNRTSRNKLRVAYLSPDFRVHPVGLSIVNLFENHDRSLFEVIAISYGPDDGSDIRARVVRGVDCFIDAATMSDEAVARILLEREIDIAVDLAGYTDRSRPAILSGHAAPVQVNYLGFPATMGSDFIDYVVADHVVAPADQQSFFSECIVQMPHCFFVTGPHKAQSHSPSSRREMELPERAFVFANFNNHTKLTPTVFEIWMKLLNEIDGSVLWLQRPNAIAIKNIQGAAVAAGVEPSRIIFAKRMQSHEDHLARLALADLFLDTLPYNAHTTATDALWSGLPVLTCAGEAFAGRVAASMLHAVDLPDLVTATLDEYHAMALRLARDATLLQSFRSRLTEARSAGKLFDTAKFCRALEDAYWAMWERWKSGEAPRGFAVESR
jgi:predicted O-linked N-acetylglucosamine transferase (SPINDLY family)